MHMDLFSLPAVGQAIMSTNIWSLSSENALAGIQASVLAWQRICHNTPEVPGSNPNQDISTFTTFDGDIHEDHVLGNTPGTLKCMNHSGNDTNFVRREYYSTLCHVCKEPF